MEQYRARNINAVRAVVELMVPAPHEVDVVRSAMDRVNHAFHDDEADDRPSSEAELRAVEPAMRVQPFDRNQQRRDGGNRADQDQKRDPDHLPALARWKRARRPELFRDPQDEIRDGGEQPDDVDGIHDGLRGLTELTLHRKSLAKV